MIETLAVIKFLGIGAFLGLTAGISPGPLLTLVIIGDFKAQPEGRCSNCHIATVY